uniref:FERM domain-containing protein n=1 Tax=Strigamia maritima TaxID=126957 RepID=T1IPS2_STRMM
MLLPCASKVRYNLAQYYTITVLITSAKFAMTIETKNKILFCDQNDGHSLKMADKVPDSWRSALHSMRQSSRTVLTSCHATLSQGKKYVAVQLITKETLYCVVEVKSKVQQVLDQIGIYLGVKDTCIFGLANLTGDEYRFINQTTKLSKVAPKQWKSLSNTGLDGTGKPLVTLLLRIQFYVDCPLFIRDKVTRTHYYLQLRENVLKHSQSSLEEHYFLLCAYALQADIGNYSEDKCSGQYFEPKNYFPSWVLERIGEDYIVQNVPAMHRDNVGLSRSEAQTAFIREASSADAPHNLHLYQLLRKKNDSKSAVWLGVCPKGIEIYEVNNGGCVKHLWATFLWTDISKLYFEKRKFEVRAMCYSNCRKYTYYADNDDKAKNLLHLCKMTHQFSMAMQPKVAELQRLEKESKKSYRESYIYSDSVDFEWEQEHGPINMTLTDFNTLPKSGKTMSEQRISVISNASSNTTSGIVSDKVQSLDGSEDDLELEIMINSPPAAPSLESLTASHLDYEDLYGPSTRINFSSLEFHARNPEEGSFPSGVHSKSSSNAMSRTDSSSSQHSASTVKSKLQQNNNLSFVSDSQSDLLSSIYFLPKMDPLPGLSNSMSFKPRAYSDCITPRTHFTQNQPLPMTLASAQRIDPMQSSTIQVCHPKPATSRILTSIGSSNSLMQIPPTNLSHVRTKIGVSSLCRPVASTPVYMHPISASVQNNSLPSPLYFQNNDFSIANQARPRSNSDDSFLFGKNFVASQRLDSSAAQSDLYDGRTGMNISPPDFHYLPPPPLYANPISGFRTRARSEESCNSLGSVKILNHVERAQSMDRGPRSELLPYPVYPPPMYSSKPTANAKQIIMRNQNGNHRLQPLDLDNLRRRSKDLDLPLISALCNDRTLMSVASGQQKRNNDISVRPANGRPLSWHVSSDVQLPLSTAAPVHSSSQWSLSAAVPVHSSPQWSMSPFSSVPNSFGKISTPTLVGNSLQTARQLFPMKLSVSSSIVSSRETSLNGIDISVA